MNKNVEPQIKFRRSYKKKGCSASSSDAAAAETATAAKPAAATAAAAAAAAASDNPNSTYTSKVRELQSNPNNWITLDLKRKRITPASILDCGD